MKVHSQPSGDKILCVTLSLIIAFSNSPAFARQKQIDFAELDKVALEELKQRNTPGAAVAVIKDGQVIYVKGYGVASIETGAPVTPDMLFRLGSTTKMLTAAALVTLAAARRRRWAKLKWPDTSADILTRRRPGTSSSKEENSGSSMKAGNQN